MTWTPEPNMTARQIERELQRQSVLFEERCKSDSTPDGNIKFSSFADLWFNQHAIPNLSHKTVQEYKKLWPRIDKAMGHLKMGKIRRVHLEKFFLNLQEDGMNARTGGKLSSSTVEHYHRLLSSMFSYAVEKDFMEKNPALKERPPKPEHEEAACLTEEQAAVLIEALENESIQFKTMISMLLYVGMRKSELHGLKWSDLNLDTGVLRIERTLQYLQRQGLHEKPPKNESSKRSIKLSDGILEVLRQYRVWQAGERLKVGELWQDGDWMFTQYDGKPRHPDSLPKQFKSFLKRSGLPDDIHLHTLRHSCASLMIASGVDLRTVSKRLGHAQLSTTGNIYAHAIQSADEAASVALDLALTRKA